MISRWVLSEVLLLLVFSFFLILYVQDLPDVLSHRTSKYEGTCEVEIYSGKSAHLEANFEEHSIWFSSGKYINAQAGSYYCKVEYYSHSDEGHSLLLYETKGGKEVETK